MTDMQSKEIRAEAERLGMKMVGVVRGLNDTYWHNVREIEPSRETAIFNSLEEGQHVVWIAVPQSWGTSQFSGWKPEEAELSDRYKAHEEAVEALEAKRLNTEVSR